jgi:hypothetical protein
VLRKRGFASGQAQAPPVPVCTRVLARERQGGDIGLLQSDQGFGPTTIFERRCSTLRDATDCREARPRLCLLCEQTTEPTLLCRAD